MSISDNVFMATLAMDSYNRGYNPGLALDGSATAIGTATIRSDDLPVGSPAAGFFAQAYDWNGKTVISYRGTDQLFDSNGNVGDVFTGWVTGGGAYSSPQAQLAALF